MFLRLTSTPRLLGTRVSRPAPDSGPRTLTQTPTGRKEPQRPTRDGGLSRRATIYQKNNRATINYPSSLDRIVPALPLKVKSYLWQLLRGICTIDVSY